MERNANHQQSSTKDVVVVGGGLAGLTAASYLARAGQKVTLFEKSENLGGMAVTQEHKGFYFNLGAHALHARSEATNVLDELGVSYTGGKPGKTWAVYDGKLSTFPQGPLTMLRTGLFGPSAKLETTRLLIGIQGMKPDALQGTTLREWIESTTSDPQVRRFLEATARVLTYTNAPQTLSAGHFIEQAQTLAKSGVIYLDRGWQTLVDGLRDRAQQLGVEIITGTRVEAVEHGNGGVTGARLHNGTLYSAQAIVIATNPGDASRLVDGGAHPALQNWAKEAVPAQFACLDVALKQLPFPGRPIAVGIDKPLFFTAQSLYAKVAPQGGVLVHTVKYLDPSTPTEPESDKRELQEWFDLVQPGWRDLVVEQRFLPRMTVTSGIVTAAQEGTAGRPGPHVPGIRNLYVAGDWVGPQGALLSASLASARLAAQLIAGKDIEAPLPLPTAA